VLRRARKNPDELVIGMDADARAMAEASRRAAAPARRAGVSNAIFLAMAAEELPGPLAGSADKVTICLPWGSLLRGLLTADVSLIARIAHLLRANGEVEIMISTTDRDVAAHGQSLDSVADAAALAASLESAGLHIVECRPADRSDVDRLSSGWGRKLGIPERRRAWLFVACQAGPGSCSRPL
jgi:16S rRNA (adenine(1408)-N(1))-methyltransferase